MPACVYGYEITIDYLVYSDYRNWIDQTMGVPIMDPDVPEYFYAINAVAQAALLLTVAVGLALAVQRTALTGQERATTWIALMATLVICSA